MPELRELQSRYPVFYFHDYEIREDARSFAVTFRFSIENLSDFSPSFTIAKPEQPQLSSYAGEKLVRETCFGLGMVELISYWKLTCPPKVIVECGALDNAQIRWWKKLYWNGLGEFFYQNHLEMDPENFMDLSSTGKPQSGLDTPFAVSGNLIPVGGGKDSLVTLDVLKGSRADNTALVINSIQSAVNSAHAAGYRGGQLVTPVRTLDPRILELNRQGFLNGHTPFSALVSFAAYLTAVLYGKKYICLSNEASANESTVKGSTVNHQYSKTFAYELDFRHYTERYLDPRIQYFSLLRPLSELQITAVFATLKPYHRIFRSCNVGQKEGIWCTHCAKCLFVCIMLSAFLDRQQLLAIFGRDMLDDPQMQDLFEQLTGIQDNKPFECVGTRDEVNTAICMSLRHAQGQPVPYLYRLYAGTSYYAYYRDRSVDLLAWNRENLVPERYQQLLHEKLEEIAHAS